MQHGAHRIIAGGLLVAKLRRLSASTTLPAQSRWMVGVGSDALPVELDMTASWMTKGSCLSFLSLVAPACASSGSVANALRARAPSDLGCEQVRMFKLSGSTYKATGCGQELTYNCTLDNAANTVCQPISSSAPTASSGGQLAPAPTMTAEPAPTAELTPAPRTAPAPGAGCQYDTQCKGERICRAGACVDPR